MYIVKSSPDLYPKSECGTAEMTVKKKYSSTIHLLPYDFEMTSTTVLKMIVANGGEARWSSYQPILVRSRP
jgi:hypothetical protein